MGKRIDYVMDCGAKGYGLLKKSAPELFMDLLKVNTLGTAIGLAGLLAMALTFWALLGNQAGAIFSGTPIPDFSGALIAAIVISVMILVLSSIASAVIGSVAYNIVENRVKGKGTMIIDQAQKNMSRVAIYTLIIWVVIIVLGAPIALTLTAEGMTALLGICILGALAFLIYLLFSFFVQFSMFELVLEERSPVDSMTSSASLIRGNILKVLLLDIILIAVGIGVSVVTTIADQILQIIPSMLGLGGTEAMLLGYAVYFVLYLGVSVVVATIGMALTLPIAYHFWRGIRK